jgi:tetratricopeptide (TPR) repeat protein
MLQGDFAPPRNSYTDERSSAVWLVYAAITLLNPQSSAIERARVHHALQLLAAKPNSSALLAKGLLLYFQRNPRAYDTLQCSPLNAPFWPVLLLLREHFVERCIAAGLAPRSMQSGSLLRCKTRLTDFPMEHPSTIPPPKPAGAADGKELSAEQKRCHRAIWAAVSRASRRAFGGVDAFVKNTKARALCKKAIAADEREGGGVGAVSDALALEPDNLFLKALRIDLRCRSREEGFEITVLEAKELTTTAPACAQAWMLSAITLYDMNALAALAAVDHALALDPSLSRAWWTRARVFDRALNFEEAVRCAERAFQHCTDPAEMVDWPATAKQWRSYCVDASEPGSPAAQGTALRNVAGWLQYGSFDEEAEVIEMLSEAKRLDPRLMAPPLWVEWALALDFLDRRTEAIAVLAEAVCGGDIALARCQQPCDSSAFLLRRRIRSEHDLTLRRQSDSGRRSGLRFAHVGGQPCAARKITDGTSESVIRTATMMLFQSAQLWARYF